MPLNLEGLRRLQDAPEPPVSAAPGPAANRAAIAVPAGQGTILGTVVRDGGRDPRSGNGGGATAGPVPVGGDSIQVRTEGGDLVTRTASADGGRFELALPSGTYLVSEEIAGVSQRIQVAPGVITNLTLVVPGV